MSQERFDKETVRERLPFLDLMAHEGIDVRRSGPHYLACCPFHGERTGSFTIHGPEHDHGHCYGCGWNGDIFKFWQERHGGGFLDALRACASLASVRPEVVEQKRKQASQVTRMTEVAGGLREKPALPKFRALTQAEIEALARIRALRAEGVSAAARDKRVGFCEWPQWQDRHECWGVAEDASGCWVVTDRERRVAQFRRLDGAMFTRRDGKQIKAWTKGSPTWPLGAAEMGDRRCVLLVEGGADMLAAYHFLEQFQRLQAVAVVEMLGSSMRIAAEALPYFRAKRVRIMMDEDEAKDERGIRAGCEAAARWTEQLTAVGAAVETFSLAGLLKRDGTKVKDLNDLAMVDEAAWTDGELRAAFFDFDF